MGGVTPGQVVLGGLRKVAECESGNKSAKQRSSMSSASVSASRFPPWVPALVSRIGGV